MEQRLHTMKFRVALFASALLAVMAVAGEAASGRFSQTLSDAERTEAGLNRLSSDQVAVIDALIRRDLVAQVRAPGGDDAPVSVFSQRLTDDERRTAGLTLLTAPELARLDALVGRNAAAIAARRLLSPPVFVPPGARLNPDGAKVAPEMHGSVSLSYGWGKGGYSERTGAMNVRYEDPVHNFTLEVGYSETHVKAPFPYRNVPDVPPFAP
jgi:hypothetical protein